MSSAECFKPTKKYRRIPEIKYADDISEMLQPEMIFLAHALMKNIVDDEVE